MLVHILSKNAVAMLGIFFGHFLVVTVKDINRVLVLKVKEQFLNHFDAVTAIWRVRNQSQFFIFKK